MQEERTVFQVLYPYLMTFGILASVWYLFVAFASGVATYTSWLDNDHRLGKFFKQAFGELFLLVVVVPVLLCVTILLCTASLVLLIFARQKLGEQWSQFNALWRRIFNHYVYLMKVVELWLAERKKKQKKFVRPRPEPRSISYHRNRSVDLEDLADPFIIFYLVYQACNLIFLLSILINFIYVVLTVQMLNIDMTVKPAPKVEVPPQEQFQPSDADKQEIDLCPCVPDYELPDAGKSTSFRNVALVDELGQVKFSSKFRCDFSKEKFSTFLDPRIVNPEIKDGSVTFLYNKHELQLNPWQAFQLLNEPMLTFMFDEQGMLYRAQSEEIQWTETK
jgi:hypothetical protein